MVIGVASVGTFVATSVGCAVLASVLSYERSSKLIALAGALAAAMATLVAMYSGMGGLWPVAVLLGAAAAWAISDARTGLIRHRLTVPLAIGTLILGVLSYGWMLCLLGAVLTFATFGLQYLFLGNRGVGGGDLMISLCIGAAFGFPSGLLAVAIASGLSVLAWGLLYALRALPSNPHIRWGPYAMAGCLVAALLHLNTLWLASQIR